MKNKKLRTAGVLMTISILLLLIFQAYWLRKSYKDEYRRLHHDLQVSLRETVLKQQMQFLFVSQNEITAPRKQSDTVRKNPDTNRILFTQHTSVSIDSGKSGLRVLVKSDSSLPRFRPRMFMGDRMEEEEPKDLSRIRVEVQIPFKNDSISVIEHEYRKSLQTMGIQLPFELSAMPIDSSEVKGMARFSQQGKKSVEAVSILRRLNPEMLVAEFENPFLLLLKRLQWPLLFAFIMLAFTTLAFVFMYRSLRQQQQLAAMKNDFIANITHELKTPVATVSVAIEALKNFNAISDAQRTKEYLDISSLELQRLNLLVDKVMKLSMFEQDKMEIQQERIDMKQLLDEVVKSMKLQFEKNAAEVSMHVEGDAFFTRGDRMHLQSVVFNLLDNALKYSPDQPKIDVELKSLPGTIQLKIADNGIGIASEYKQKVFEKFFRVPHGNTHNIKGYGLGLSYVYEVVQRHGGTITVESKEGAGSIFTVELKRETPSNSPKGEG